MDNRTKLALLICGCGSAASFGQEALNRNVDAQRHTQQTRSRIESMPYTAKFKDLRVLVSPSLSLEWNDNIRLQDEDPKGDFIIRPATGFHLFHPITQQNILSVDVAVGYDKFVDNSEYDRLTVTPGSNISFDVFVRDVQLNFHNRFSYQLDPVYSGAVANTGEFGGIDNTAGVLATWNLNRAQLSAGYDFVRFISSQQEFEYMDRSSHQFVARGGVLVHPTITVGLEATASPSFYDENIRQNDSVGYSIGTYANWQVTDFISVAPRVGYTMYTFSENDVGFSPDDFNAIYYGLDLNHAVSKLVSYRFSFQRQINPGVQGNLSDVLGVNLTASWSIIRDWPIATGIFFDDGTETRGVASEDYYRYGANLSVGRQLTERSDLRLAYALVLRDSNVATRDYVNNRVTLSINYRL